MTGLDQAGRLFDDRVKCWSILTTMTIQKYLDLVSLAYRARGGLQYQREALKTTSGKRIRARMVSDVMEGTVLPPVVLGLVITEQEMGDVGVLSQQETEDRILGQWCNQISIIDGMQRTTALIEAFEKRKELHDRVVRVECWLASKTDSLIYRMLVLNTGQVPWNLKRQLQVVYAPLIEELKKNVTFERLLNVDAAERRTKGGEFRPDSMIEAYLAFGLRRTEIETQESLAEEFSRLDMAEAISSEKYSHFFYPVVQMMVDLDKAFSRLDEVSEPQDSEGVTSKFPIGRNIFDSQPARIGFVVAFSVAILGRLGNDKPLQDSNTILDSLQQQVASLVQRLSVLPDQGLRDFLGLEVLTERLGGQKRSAIGRYERAFFEDAFKVLIEEKHELPSLEVCWRA
jgi:hypothetical protein